MQACHAKLQSACGSILDALYFSDAHPSVSESILRKPGSGMLEKAVARFQLDVAQCWIVGDRLRDMAAGAAIGVRGILVGEEETVRAPRSRPARSHGAYLRPMSKDEKPGWIAKNRNTVFLMVCVIIGS